MYRYIRRLAPALLPLIASLAFGDAALSPQRAIAQSDGPPLRVITTPLEVAAGVYYAQEGGFFARNGLRVEITSLANGQAAASAVLGGSADIGVGNLLSMATAYKKGLGLVFIAPAARYNERAPTTELVVENASPIHTAKDLIGGTIAVQALADVMVIATKEWLANGGVDPTKVTFIELPVPEMIDALQRHRVAAAMIGEPALTTGLGQRSIREISSPFSAIGKSFILNGWYAKATWIATHRDEAKRFAAAVIAGQKWANSHPQESGQVFLKNSSFDPAILGKINRATFADRFEPGLVQPVIDAAARYNLIDGSFASSDMYTQLR
jgi:NitT/TauT family transport system substrate-binding protein